MSTVNLAIQNPSKWTNEVNIFPYDAFNLISGIERFFPHHKITGNGKKLVKPVYQELKNKIDVLIGNPPFTRGKRLSKGYKTFLSNLREYLWLLHELNPLMLQMKLLN